MKRFVIALMIGCFIGACSSAPSGGGGGTDDGAMDDGPIAEGISAALGEPMPSASAEQLAAFERGKAVANRRFDIADGLGPAFNLVSCAGCHEKPTTGGGSGLYRSFFIGGRTTDDGAFLFTESAGMAGGVIRVFDYSADEPFRPDVPEDTNVFAQRNCIPFFGAGLMAELSEEVILANADPDDENGDGISGKPNFDRGFVGRFGRKAQTVSIEGFIRGPLFNHLGVTTEPLSDELRSQLPVDSSAQETMKAIARMPFDGKVTPHMQAAAPDAPNFDNDAATDPELSQADLFDLVSFSMLLAAPEFDEPTEQTNRGRLAFREANCHLCHIPRLEGPRGPVPLYSDLLLHDMGEALADGLIFKDAGGSEFRTQPLWGIAAVGPYLHDGRAETIEEAILAHGGEAQAARDAFDAFDAQKKEDVIEFLLSLGGRNQFTTGLVEPNAPIVAVGEYGGPFRDLSEEEQARFIRGRELYDHDFGLASGVGFPRFNGDSCRACHFDPVIGGSGPRDVNVMRHGIMNAEGQFTSPVVGTILHKQTADLALPALPQSGVNVYEHRQTPHTFGLGLIDGISAETITANADPDDANGDGISGRVSMTDDGRVGKLGWKAQVPSVAEFVRDGMAAELGLTVEAQEGLTFGRLDDDDGVEDPEVSATEAEDLTFFIAMLAGPPRQPADDEAQVAQGETIFEEIGCALCHIPSLPAVVEGVATDVPLYSDILLHEILPAGSVGIEDTSASVLEFRTAPLWGLSQTAPYFHTGEADTVDQAIRLHDGEAADIRQAYENLSEDDRAALLAFLNTL